MINEATRNIADTHGLIENVLIPQREQLIEELANLNRLIDEAQSYIVTITNERAAGHEAYLERLDENNAGIEAVHEALAVLGQLNGDDTSLL